MISLVLVGCGSIAKLAHLPALAQLRADGLVEIAGVCDANASAARVAAEQFDIPRSGSDWARMVRETGATAVSICVPPGPNVQLAIDALAMGLHVMTEKPPARSEVQAARMADAARAHPECVTMVAFNRRHAPLYTRAMDASRRLGAPHAFHGRFTRAALGGEPSNTAADWITSDGAHVLDLALATMGYPERIAVARHRSGAGPDNVWSLQLHGATGASVLVFDFAAGRRVERFEWSGPGYDVVLELPHRAEWSQRGADVEEWRASQLTGTEDFFLDYGFVDEYRRFVDAIAGRAQRPETSFEYGWSFMHLVDEILACRDGESRELAPPRAEVAGRSVATRGAEDVAAERGSGTVVEHALDAMGALEPGRRPVVCVLQDGSAQARYFNGALLARVTERCEWRARGSGLDDADAIITGWGGAPLTREALERAAHLELVIVIGASVKNVAPEYLLERGVAVCNTADAIGASVAEHCLLLMLAGLRRVTDVDRAMHRKGWPPNSEQLLSIKTLRRTVERVPPLRAMKPVLRPAARRILAKRNGGAGAGSQWSDLRGQVVALIGWGHVARHVAALLRPFDCELLVCSDSVSAAELARVGARRVQLGEALGSAKVVSLHKGLTERTRGMLGAAELALLQPGAVLVNTARGALVDEAALIARLGRGDIVAALDVYHEEPLRRRHALRRLPNTILTPHNASTTPQCQRRVGAQALEILLNWLSGHAVSRIDTERLVAMT